MPKILITTFPFAEYNNYPIDMLNTSGVEYVINPLGRKLREEELIDMVSDFDVIIAGTEPITKRVMLRAPKLKLISRVGVGLDSVDLNAAKKQNIKLAYTPEAPAPAVADLALSLILALIRSVHLANADMHNNNWKRYFGKGIADACIGIIGVGRIGSRVFSHLESLGAKNILVYDINSNLVNSRYQNSFVDLDFLLKNSDLISLHVPLNFHTKNLIDRKRIFSMKKGAMIVNTARGGIVNELDLAAALVSGQIKSAAMDVFEKEPYEGPLSNLKNCLLTSHMGSMTFECRSRMEIEATDEALRYLRGEVLRQPVPESEYDMNDKVI